MSPISIPAAVLLPQPWRLPQWKEEPAVGTQPPDHSPVSGDDHGMGGKLPDPLPAHLGGGLPRGIRVFLACSMLVLIRSTVFA